MNSVILMGYISNELKWSQESYCKFTLAVKRRFSREDKTDFINCTAFGKTGDFIGTYFTKGSKILISGEIHTDSYEKEGQKIYTTGVVVNNAEFCEKAEKKTQIPEKSSEGFYMPVEDEGLPFI